MKPLLRIYHPWWSWECVKAGFYNTLPPEGMDADQARERYREFLSDLELFSESITRVMKEWTHSSDQFLSNGNINRIAWLGQSSMCIHTGIPSCFRGGFKLLTPEQQIDANALAEQRLNEWLEAKCSQRAA